MIDVLRSLPGGDIKSPHSIYIPEADIMILLKVKGLVSGFDTRIPTKHELSTCVHVLLTKTPIGDTSGLYLEQQENNFENNNRNDLDLSSPRGGCKLFEMHLRTEVSAFFSSVSNNLQDGSFLENL